MFLLISYCSKIADKKEKQEKKQQRQQDLNSGETQSCNVCCADLDISSAKK